MGQRLRNPEPGRRVRYRTLTVPADVANQVPVGAEFECEWHPDGILFRAVGTRSMDPKQAMALAADAIKLMLGGYPRQAVAALEQAAHELGEMLP